MDNPDLVMIPKLSFNELITLADPGLKIPSSTWFNHAPSPRNFIDEECGKTYEAKVWKPENSVLTREVRSHFKSLGDFHGNTAALLAWIIKHKFTDNCATLPEVDRLCSYPGSRVGWDYVQLEYTCPGPCFCLYSYTYDTLGNPTRRIFGSINRLDNFLHDYYQWDPRWSFVAFREMKK